MHDGIRHVRSRDRVDVAVHDLGGTGPTLLLCHATGFHGQLWAPVADHLPNYDCIAPDLRAHGSAITPDDAGLDWDGYAADVLAVVDALGDTPLLGAGHSMGGAALLLAEQARPGTFSAIWCFEPIVFPPLPGEQSENPLVDGARKRRADFPSHEAAIGHFAAKPPFEILDPNALAAYVRHGFRSTVDGVTLRCRPENEARTYEMGRRHHGFERLGSIECPVVVVAGARDPGPRDIAPLVAERLPRARFELHDELGHFGPAEDPPVIASSIRRAFA